MKWRSLEERAPQTEVRSLRDIYSDRKELIARYVPADIRAIHARAVEELKQSRIAERALQKGDPAPDFELLDQNAKLVRSADFLQRGPLTVCFFRGRWCPFCVGQMEAMNAVVPRLEELGASLVGISPQTVHRSYLMSDQHKLRFPLLSDSGNRVAQQFGIVYRVPEYQQEVYAKAFVNLPFINGGPSWELPIPAIFVLGESEGHNRDERQDAQSQSPDSKAIVLYASANPDYADRPEPQEVAEFLAQVFS